MTSNPFKAWFTDAEAGPADLVCCHLRRLLAADAKLVTIFGVDAIEVVPTLDSPDFTRPPRLQLGYDTAPTEDSAPTSIDRREVRIVIRIAHEWQTWETLAQGAPGGGSWPWAKPSLDSLENYILQIVKAARKLPATMPSGATANLVHDGPEIGPFQAAGGRQRQDNTFLLYRDCRVSYGVRIDRNTGQLLNVAANPA